MDSTGNLAMKLSDTHVNCVNKKRKKSLIPSSTIQRSMKIKGIPVISAIKKTYHNQEAVPECTKYSCDDCNQIKRMKRATQFFHLKNAVVRQFCQKDGGPRLPEIAFYMLLYLCYLFSVTCFLLFAVCYLLSFHCYLLPFICCFLSVPFYLIVLNTCKILITWTPVVQLIILLGGTPCI